MSCRKVICGFLTLLLFLSLFKSPTAFAMPQKAGVFKDYKRVAAVKYDTLSAQNMINNISDTNTNWTVKCRTYVSLRVKPAFKAKTILRIKSGEQVSLISFKGRFAKVSYEKGGKIYTGYILGIYMVLPDERSYKAELETVKPVFLYSYEQMLSDLETLSKKYPERLSICSVGRSEEGRELVLAVMGNPKAENKILIHAAIHAREYITTTLVMAQMDYMLSHENLLYSGTDISIGRLLDCTCFCILPMVNPDGVNIVQSRILPQMFKDKYSQKIASLWKANAKGIDLNANFDADWEDYAFHAANERGPYRYKGEAPECAAESKALADYMRKNKFSLTLSYHTTGSVIYSAYGDNTKINAKGRELAELICQQSGFNLNTQTKGSTAGFKDWAIEKCSTPSLTIEFATYKNPIDIQEFSNIWYRGRDIPIISAMWLLQSNNK